MFPSSLRIGRVFESVLPCHLFNSSLWNTANSITFFIRVVHLFSLLLDLVFGFNRLRTPSQFLKANYRIWSTIGLKDLTSVGIQFCTPKILGFPSSIPWVSISITLEVLLWYYWGGKIFLSSLSLYILVVVPHTFLPLRRSRMQAWPSS